MTSFDELIQSSSSVSDLSFRSSIVNLDHNAFPMPDTNQSQPQSRTRLQTDNIVCPGSSSFSSAHEDLVQVEQTIDQLLHSSSGQSDACDALSFFEDAEIERLNQQLCHRLSIRFEESTEEELDRFINESLKECSSASSSHLSLVSALANNTSNHHHHHHNATIVGSVNSSLIGRARLGSLRSLRSESQLSGQKSEMYGRFRTCNSLDQSEFINDDSLSNQTSSDQSLANNRLQATAFLDTDIKRLDAEIVAAKTSNECVNRSSGFRKFVLYSVLFKRSRGLENTPCVLERRYNDFARLYRRVCSMCSDYQSFEFPGKHLIGNFRPDVITRRSRMFARFLHVLIDDERLLNSPPLIQFVFEKEFQECARLLRTQQLEEAVSVLENLFNMILLLVLRLGGIQRLVRFDLVFITLCSLIACLHELDQPHRAQSYVEKIFDLCDTRPELFACELIIPLLLLCVQLYSRLCKDYSAFNRQLLHLHQQGVRYTRSESLLELLTISSQSYLQVDNPLFRFLLPDLR